jgi:very-short-patch-repair endonuclease
MNTLKYDYNAIKENLIEYFTLKDVSLCTDFQGTKISKEKIKYLLNIDNLENYCELKTVHTLILNSNYDTIYDVWLKKLFLIICTEQCDGYERIILCCGLTQQFQFTYAVYTFVKALYDDMDIKVEDVFLTKFRFTEMLTKSNTGPRTDITIEQARLILECDEHQHASSDASEKDMKRDFLIKSKNYQVLRYSVKDNVENFLKNKLYPVLVERNCMFRLKIMDYIVIKMLERGHDETMVKLMFEELCSEYLDDSNKKIIGLIPNELTLGILRDFLNIEEDDEEFDDNINEYLEDLPYPYLKNDDELIFSPKAFDYIVMQLDASEYPTIVEIRKLFIDIKEFFVKCLCDMAHKHIEINNASDNAYHIIANYAYERAKKDFYKEHEKMVNENKYLLEKVKMYDEIFKSKLDQNNRGNVRIKLKKVSEHLIVDKTIIPELPDVVFTNSTSDIIEVNKLYAYLDIIRNTHSIKITSNKQIIAKLNLALDNKHCKDDITRSIVYKCKFKTLTINLDP